MKLIEKAGITSKRVEVFIRDSTVTTTRAGKTGLTSSDVTMYYTRDDDGNAGANAVTLSAGTRGTWSSGGFKEKDSTNYPGVYEVGLPNAMLASGSKWCNAMVRGTGLDDTDIEIQLVAYDPYDATALGLSGITGGISVPAWRTFVQYKVGVTSQRIEIFIPDATSSSGAGKTGLTQASSGLKWYYARENDGNTGATSVTPASATLGTFTSGGFKEKDATNYPGWYEIGIPNAVLAGSAQWATMVIYGVSGTAPSQVVVQLVAYDPQDAVALGLSGIGGGGSSSVSGSQVAYQFKAGVTSKRVEIFVPDASSSTGAGKTGLTFSSSGLKWYYIREDDGNTGATSVTPVTATLGTWTSAGFKEKDATNYPGWYEIGIPNAVLAAGATWANMMIYGVTGATPSKIFIQLVAYDPQDANRLGLAGIPNGSIVAKRGATKVFTFPMFNSSTHQMQTGLTVTATRTIDGTTVAACTNAVTEVGGGYYVITLSTTDTNGESIGLKFSATGADDLPYTILTQP